MGAKTLTDASIKAEISRAISDGRRTDIYDAVIRGLILRLTPKGAASFAYAYRPKGGRATQRITIGPYPRVPLAKARRIAKEYSEATALGKDIAAERRAQREEAAKAAMELAARITANDAIDRYLRLQIRKDRTRANYTAVFRKDVRPAIGLKALADVSKADVQAILDGIEDRGVFLQAGLVFAVVRSWLNWCVGRGYIEESPLKGMKSPHGPSVRDRFLSVSEIRAFWRLLPALAMPDNMREVFRLQLLLGQRVGEVAGMKRHEVDLVRKVWTIPSERSKNELAHEVPLPPMARSIIEAAMTRTSGQVLLPDEKGFAYTPEALAMRLMRSQRIFDFRKPDGTPNPFTSHDLRRTLATWLEQSGTPSSIVSLVLNHQSGKGQTVTAMHYTHGDTLKPKRLALTTWEVHIRTILAGDDPFAATFDDADAIEAELLKNAPVLDHNVVPFRKATP